MVEQQTTTLTTALKDALQQELQGNILPYWINMVDHQHGGFHGRIDGFNNLVEKSDKGVILNTRILWTFSQASHTVKDNVLKKQCVEMAHRAYQYITENFLDHDHGGLYWMLDYRGNPTQTKKQVYAQAFGIYALSEYYLAFRQREALNLAIELFKLLEKHSYDRHENGYFEAFDREWKLLDDLRLSDKDANEKKTMNTHLHVLEAYTNLYRCWEDAHLRHQLKNLIGLFINKIVAPNHHLTLFFDEHWNVKSSAISFGHDIEAGWLLQEAAEVLDDADLISQTQALAVAITDTVIAEGLNEAGALINEIHGNGKIDTDMHWWPQAEALVGFVNAWQVTGRLTYLERAATLWQFVCHNMLDDKGEWHWRLKADLSVVRSEDKAGPWKCPYHNGRACMEIIRRFTLYNV